MALDRNTRQTIRDFVKSQPRAMQEIADHIDKSWRTADRYTEQMAKEEGIIQRKTFRKGTRGALKIVYWNNTETFNSSQIQDQLLDSIKAGRDKTDFSPFDIYQVADKDKRNAFAERQAHENVEAKHDLFTRLREAQESIKFFSGNLSWANVTHNNEQAIDVFRELAEDDIHIKFLGRVDIGSLSNAEQLLNLNQTLKSDRINIRHSEQPLRAFIIDDNLVQFKELRHPDHDNDLDHHTYLFYEITDNEWIEWIDTVFWKLYRGGIPAKRRIDDLKSIRNIQQI